MNFGDLKAEVATTNLGRDSAEDLTIAGKAVNWVLTEHLPKKGLKAFLTNTNLTTTADIEYVDLPSNFDGLKLARILQDDGDYIILSDFPWVDFENMDTDEPTNKMVLPHSASWRLYLRLIPDDAYTINIWYYAKQTTLVTDDTTPILSTIYGDAPIISGATWRMATVLEIDEARRRWEKTFDKVDLPELLAWQGKVGGEQKYHPTHNPYK